MAMDLEELQLQLEKVLCEVSEDILIKLAVFLKLDEVKYQGKSKLSITRLLRREIEEQVAQIEDENQRHVFLEKIRGLRLLIKKPLQRRLETRNLKF